MSIMTYKGYSARVEYDERDGIFVGRVMGLRDMISFHGETVKELRTDFANAIEHYLAVCAKHGEKPEKPYSGKLMLRIPPEVHAATAIAAAAAGESINQWAAEALREAAASDRPERRYGCLLLPSNLQRPTGLPRVGATPGHRKEPEYASRYNASF